MSLYKENPQLYHKEYHKQWYQNNHDKQLARVQQRRKELIEWFSALKATLNCSICGENHPACLDFHHKDATTKDFDIAIMVSNGNNKEKILAEIAKCDVMCSNCHRKFHYNERMGVPGIEPE